jgi:hypothetical protein
VYVEFRHSRRYSGWHLCTRCTSACCPWLLENPQKLVPGFEVDMGVARTYRLFRDLPPYVGDDLSVVGVGRRSCPNENFSQVSMPPRSRASYDASFVVKLLRNLHPPQPPAQLCKCAPPCMPSLQSHDESTSPGLLEKSTGRWASAFARGRRCRWKPIADEHAASGWDWRHLVRAFRIGPEKLVILSSGK